MSILKYHQTTFDLIKKAPIISEKELEAIDKREKELGIEFPAAVRELYSIEGIHKLISFYSNSDYMCPPDRVGEISLGNSLEEKYAQPKFVTFLYENESIFKLAFELDVSDDPPVWIWGDFYEDEEGNPIWVKAGNHFSSFIYSWFWNFLYFQSGLQLVGISKELSTPDLTFLQSNLNEVRLFLEAKVLLNDSFFFNSHNFEGLESHLKIYKDSGGEIVWRLEAASVVRLYNLAKLVVQCSGFKDTKFNTFNDYSISPKAQEEANKLLSLLGKNPNYRKFRRG